MNKLGRVYVVLIDHATKRVVINLKDCLLSDRNAHLEGLIGLFGGGRDIEDGGDDLTTLSRELKEELGEYGESLNLDDATHFHTFQDEPIEVYVLEIDLSGTEEDQGILRVIRRACNEGEAAIRSFAFIQRTPDSWFVPGAKQAYMHAILHTP